MAAIASSWRRVLARKVLSAVRLLLDDWKPIGALDGDPNRHGTRLDGLPVLGGPDLLRELTDVAVIVCVANAHRPDGRLRVVRRLKPARPSVGHGCTSSGLRS